MSARVSEVGQESYSTSTVPYSYDNAEQQADLGPMTSIKVDCVQKYCRSDR